MLSESQRASALYRFLQGVVCLGLGFNELDELYGDIGRSRRAPASASTGPTRGILGVP